MAAIVAFPLAIVGLQASPSSAPDPQPEDYNTSDGVVRTSLQHAHSQQNPERDWGLDTLNAVRFAFYALNEERATRNTDGSA